MTWRHRAMLPAAIAAVFWPALGGAYVYDDTVLVVRNQALQQGDLVALLTQPLFGAGNAYWRPLTSLSLWLGHTAGGAAGIHALALLLHAASALAAFALAKRLLGDERRAGWAALLFALHPVQVESVAWCSAINDPLWGLCALLAMLAVHHWRDRGVRGLPWAAGAACFAALLCKENALAALPLVVASFAWSRPRGDSAGGWVSLRPVLLALGAAFVAWYGLRALVFHDAAAGLLRAPDAPPQHWLRAASAPAELLLRHVFLLVQPWPLTPFRTYETDVEPLRGALLLAFALGAVLVAGLRFRGVRPVRRLALALVVLPLVPTLLRHAAIGAYPIADRYLYLPVLGAGLLLVDMLEGRAARWVLPPLLLAAATVSFVQTWVWHDQERFVRHTAHHAVRDPNVLVLRGDLAQARAQTGDAAALASARRDYAQAEALAQSLSGGAPHRALGAARLGLAWCLLVEQGGQRGPGTPQLVAAFERAVDTDPSVAAAWVGLGVARGIADQPAPAEAAFRRALVIEADHPEAWFNLGYLQVRIGRRDAARTSLEQALRCNPQNVAARQLLAQLR